VTVECANFYRCDLSDADAVTCYLMIEPMPKLAVFLDTMLRSDTAVVALRVSHLSKNDIKPRHQFEGGPAGDGARRTGNGCVLGCRGLGCGCGFKTTSWAGAGGVDDSFSLMSSWTACNVATSRAIWSCFAASRSTLRLTTSRLATKGSSCCIRSGDTAETTGDFAAETGNNQASVGARSATISLAASP
jgi:hypothetical protein